MVQGRIRYDLNIINAERFYQLPQFLFEGELKNLRNDARVLYALLKDRHQLSLKNGWINEAGEVYLIYRTIDMAEMLGCSEKTAKKALDQLIEYGLIEKERIGCNQPNRLYLTYLVKNTGSVKSIGPDTNILPIRKGKNYGSSPVKITDPDPQNLPANHTNYNHTDFSYTEISQSFIHGVETSVEKGVEQEDISAVSKFKSIDQGREIEELLDVGVLKKRSKHYVNKEKKEVNEQEALFEAILEKAQLEYCTDPMAARQALQRLFWQISPLMVNGVSIPPEKVREDLLKINIDVINAAFEDYFAQAARQKIRNPIAYLSVCIYNTLWDNQLKLRTQMEYDGLNKKSWDVSEGIP